jgi:hypothetical protein
MRHELGQRRHAARVATSHSVHRLSSPSLDVIVTASTWPFGNRLVEAGAPLFGFARR